MLVLIGGVALLFIFLEGVSFGARGGGQTSADLLSGRTFNDRGLWPPPASHKLPAIIAPVSIYTSLSLTPRPLPLQNP